MTLKGTTICAVRKDGKIAVAGDGQVTMGESTIFKATAHKVRRIYGGKVVTGFAGTVSDAFALCDRFEAKLEQYSGNLERAAVELAQEWRNDKAMRKLEAMLIVASGETLMIVSGTGEVIEPDDGIAAVDHVHLHFEESALDALAQAAQQENETREDIGARRLHTLFEKMLEDISFNAGGDMPDVDVTINGDYVAEHLGGDGKKLDMRQ